MRTHRMIGTMVVATAWALSMGCSAAPDGTETTGEQASALPDLPPPVREELCTQTCTYQDACDEPCSMGGRESTCGAIHKCATANPDHDGVPSSRDNCPTWTNANQADCDGDGVGNVCDTNEGTFVRSTRRWYCSEYVANPVPTYPDLWMMPYAEADAYEDVSACHEPPRLSQPVGNAMGCSIVSGFYQGDISACCSQFVAALEMNPRFCLGYTAPSLAACYEATR